jgi:hypothetical protein
VSPSSQSTSQASGDSLPIYGQFELGLLGSAIRRTAANAQKLKGTSLGALMVFRLYFCRYLAVGFGGGIDGPADKGGFSEDVTNGATSGSQSSSVTVRTCIIPANPTSRTACSSQ